MKTQISRNSYRPEKRYSGVYQQQGRMITDADWNELMQVLQGRLQDVLKDVIGSGVPNDGKGISLQKNGSGTDWDINIGAGHLYAGGVLGILLNDTVLTTQEDLPAIPLPTLDGVDSFVFYADVWERPITALEDVGLLDAGLHGADTTTRKQTMVQIKWCTKPLDPELETDNPGIGDAPLSISLRTISELKDDCDPCAIEIVQEQENIGNYLFRVEVHDAYNDADGQHLILKWSSENGAEQHTLGNEPEEFNEGPWIYEFFNRDTEKTLGRQFAPRSGTFPQIGRLHAEYPNNLATFLEDSDYLNATVPWLVRRWDGYCELLKDSGDWELVSGKDKVHTLSSNATDASRDGYVNLTDSTRVVLQLGSKSLLLDLELAGKSFLRGDYWLCSVREAVHTPGDNLLADALPEGVQHHYVKLGELDSSGNFDSCISDEECRRNAFPPLSNIRAYDVGYTVPECPPDPSSPPTVQSLMSDILGSTWPDLDGDKRNSVADILNALLCELDAKKLPYDPSLQSVYWGDILDDASENLPNTVQDAIDDIISKYESSDIWYEHDVENDGPCDSLSYGADTVRTALGLDFDADHPNGIKLNQILEALLCRLDASKLPYNPSIQSADWDDITEQEGGTEPVYPLTVQEAIDTLVDNLESSDIGYSIPDCPVVPDAPPTLKDLMGLSGHTNVKELWNKLLCDLKAGNTPYDARILPAIEARWTDLLAGSGTTLPPTVQEAVDNLLLNLGSGGGGGLAWIINELVKKVAISGRDFEDDELNAKPDRQKALSESPVGKDNSLLDATAGMVMNIVRFAYGTVMEFLDIGNAEPVEGRRIGHSGGVNLHLLATTEGYVSLWRHIQDRKTFATDFFKQRFLLVAVYTAVILLGRRFLNNPNAGEQEAYDELMQRIRDANTQFGSNDSWNGELIRHVLIEKFFQPLLDSEYLDHLALGNLRDLILEYIAELWRKVVCELLIDDCKPIQLPEGEEWMQQIETLLDAMGRGLEGDGLVRRLNTDGTYLQIRDLFLQARPGGRMDYSWILALNNIDGYSVGILNRYSHEQIFHAMDGNQTECPLPELTLIPMREQKWFDILELRVGSEMMLMKVQGSGGIVYCAFSLDKVDPLSGEFLIWGDLHNGLSFVDRASGETVLQIPFPDAVVFTLDNTDTKLVDGLTDNLQLVAHTVTEVVDSVDFQCSTYNPMFSIPGRIPIGVRSSYAGLHGVYSLSADASTDSSHLLVVVNISDGQVINLMRGVDEAGAPTRRWMDGVRLELMTSMFSHMNSYRIIGAAHDQMIFEHGTSGPRIWTFVPFRAMHDSLWGGDDIYLRGILNTSLVGDDPYLHLNNVDRPFEEGGIDDYHAGNGPWISCQPTRNERYFYKCYEGVFPTLDIVLPGGATDRSQTQTIYSVEEFTDRKRILSLCAEYNTIEYHALYIG